MERQEFRLNWATIPVSLSPLNTSHLERVASLNLSRMKFLFGQSIEGDWITMVSRNFDKSKLLYSFLVN